MMRFYYVQPFIGLIPTTGGIIGQIIIYVFFVIEFGSADTNRTGPSSPRNGVRFYPLQWMSEYTTYFNG